MSVDKVIVGPSHTGLGVFAKVAIPAGETIFYVTGPLLTYEEVLALPLTGENSIQVDSGRYVDPLFPGRYLNHSCDPNAGFTDDIRLVALRAIPPGEEIRFDYSTTMMERLWELDCQCGSPACRGRVQDFDLIPRELQDRYLGQGVVQDFIVRSLIAQDEGTEPPAPPVLFDRGLPSTGDHVS